MTSLSSEDERLPNNPDAVASVDIFKDTEQLWTKIVCGTSRIT